MQSRFIKVSLFINHLLVILFMIELTAYPLTVQSLVPLLLATVLLLDITYIASCNIKENKILFLFCALLALDSWYLLLNIRTTAIVDNCFQLLSAIIVYLSIRFCFLFTFQGYHYKYKNLIDTLLLLLCIGTIFSMFFSMKVYACFYGLQFVGSILCFCLILCCHWKRISFILRNEYKAIRFAFFVTTVSFLMYYFATRTLVNPMSNFGIYIVVLLFSISIHQIIFKESIGTPLSALLNFKQRFAFLLISISTLSFISIALNFSFLIFMILVHLLFALIFLCNILLEENLKQNRTKLIQNNNYTFALMQLQHDEALKAEFANFLHDDVLQDLLSIKNILNKSHLPEIQKLIYDTLSHLNTRIRNQMQGYHTVIIKSLTIKENLAQLIQSVANMFPYRTIYVTFSCSDTLFIAEPYDLLVYRLIKELLTNIYKHSTGDKAWVTVTLKKDKIKLSVCDNGTNITLLNLQERSTTSLPKGISSIKEQVIQLGGTMTLSSHIPQGIQIEIELTMRGADSYQYFTH